MFTSKSKEEEVVGSVATSPTYLGVRKVGVLRERGFLLVDLLQP